MPRTARKKRRSSSSTALVPYRAAVVKKPVMLRVRSVQRPSRTATVRYADKIGKTVPAMSQYSQRFVGSELFASVDVAGSNAKLVGKLISPATLGPRIATLASCYEKYRVNSLTFELSFTGNISTTVQVVQGFDTDAGDPDPPQTLDGVRQILSWRHSQAVAMLDGGSHSMRVVIQQPEVGYYTSYDPAGDYRFSYCGQYYLYSMFGGSVHCVVTVHYDLTFYEPQTGDVAFGAGDVGSTVAKPTSDSNAWDVATVKAMIEKCAAALGASVYVDGSGHVHLQLGPGDYDLWQLYKPATSPGGAVGFASPVVENAFTTTDDVQSFTDSTSSYSVFRTFIRVAPGRIADVVGRFLNSAYTESGSPSASVWVARRAAAIVDYY